MAISAVSLGTTATELLIGSSSVQKAIIGFSFCNYSSTSTKVNVWLVPSGELPQNSNILLKEIDIAATDTCIFSEFKIVLNDGEKLIASAETTNSVSAVVSWYQF